MENSSEQLKLSDEFSAPTYEEWLKLVESQLKGAPFEKKLVSKTSEGISIQPIYRKTDIDGESIAQSLPGEAPFSRGTRASGLAGSGWDILQRNEHPDAARFNKAASEDISRGLNSLSIILDRAGKSGLNPDQAVSGEVGKNGLSVFNSGDIARALEGVDISQVSFYIDAGVEALSLVSLMSAFLQSRRIPLSELKGKVVFDPLANLATNGELEQSLNFWYDNMARLCGWAGRNAPDLRTLAVDARPYYEGGASAVQEAACAMAAGAEYLREMLKRGLDVNKVASGMSFFFSIGSDFFMEIAKFRAVRSMWAKVAGAFGADANSIKMNLHISAGKRGKSLFDPYVNMLRTTTEAFSAVIAGCDSLDVITFDDIHGTLNDTSRRIAANTQMIIKEECRGDRVIDPAGGSWFVESLTEQLGEKAWTMFQEIEKAGGASEALKQGVIQEEIEKTRKERSNEIALRKKVILGTNMFPNLNEEIPDKTPDYDEIYEKRLEEVAKSRSDADEAPLKKLKETLSGDEISGEEALNAMIEAASKGNGLGDLSAALKSDSKEKMTIKPLVIRREAEDYEDLRKAAMRFKEETGDLPKVFLAGMGPLRQHKARSDFSLSFLQPGGFDIIYNQGFDSVEAAAKAAVASGAPIVVICSTDDAYPEIVPELSALIKEKKPETTIALAGYPKEHIENFTKAGVDEFIHLKAKNFETLKKFQEKAGVK